ncbi:hypothetical protein D3C80_1574970 [compost metagenome]
MWELPHLLLSGEQEALIGTRAPQEQGELAELLSRMIEAETGLLIRPLSWFTDADHIFSHIHWKMRFFIADLGEELQEELAAAHEAAESAGVYMANDNNSHEVIVKEPVRIHDNNDKLPQNYHWMSRADMETMPFPNLFVRIFKQYWKS